MTGARRFGWLAALALVALALGACARDRNQVSVAIGTAPYQPAPSPKYAKLFRPYAQMSALAYTDRTYVDANLCPDAKALAGHDLELANWQHQLNHENWTCKFGGIGFNDCPRGLHCVDGLQFQVWERRDCSQAVIAFRGSDVRDIGDLLSDFRWFLLAPVFDEYREVEAEINSIIGKLVKEGCRPRQIVATGHSLGGGLAQNAAYASKGALGISYVYAFDPSPVTGAFDIPWATRMETIKRFGVDRVYQSGELLSLPRYIASGIFPSPSCMPRVRIVRFATVEETSLIERHHISKLTEGLLSLEKNAGPGPLPNDYDKAVNCDFSNVQ